MSKEDFISKLKKMKSDSKSPSIIGDTLEKIEALEKQNEELKEKIEKRDEVLQGLEQTLEQTMGEKDDLKKDLTNKISDLENDIKDLQSKITTLTEENVSLNKELVDLKEKSPGDSFTPVEVAEATTASNGPMSGLVDELQGKINKYKKAVAKLKKENETLKQTQSGDTSGLSNEITELKKENEMLNNEISKLKEQLEEKATATTEGQTSDSMIEELQEQLKQKDKMINELKISKAAEATTPSGGPMSGLVDELQGKINKLKLALKEKNKKIEELQKK